MPGYQAQGNNYFAIGQSAVSHTGQSQAGYSSPHYDQQQQQQQGQGQGMRVGQPLSSYKQPVYQQHASIAQCRPVLAAPSARHQQAIDADEPEDDFQWDKIM